MAQIIIEADLGTLSNDILRGKIQTDNHGGITTLHSPDDFVYDYIYNYGDTIYGMSGNDIIIGDRYDTFSQDYGYDRLYGDDGNDVIYGDTGRENPNFKTTLHSGSGNVLVGGYGRDTIWGGGGANGDYIYGDLEINGPGTTDDGSDFLFGLGGNDYIYGGGGNDYIDGGVDNDGNLKGGVGNDTIRGGVGNDYMYGGAGSDVFIADAGDDYIDGDGEVVHTTEIDTLSYIEMLGLVNVDLSNRNGQSTNAGGLDTIRGIEKLIGSNFNDRLFGSDAAEQIFGMNGTDDVRGGLGNDTVGGGDANDKVTGGGGNDQAYGGNGNDSVYGEDGADRLYGDAANDYLNGGVENDTMYGGLGNDVIQGGTSGADWLFGDAGNDRLYGGNGHDTMVGGLGQDSFYFTDILTVANIDRIIGYSAVDDSIMLSKAVFKALGLTMTADEFYTGAAAHDATDHIIYNKVTGALLYDSNANVAGGTFVVAYIDKGLPLTFSDFVLV